MRMMKQLLLLIGLFSAILADDYSNRYHDVQSEDDEVNEKNDEWPKQVTTVCKQDTKQKAMYGNMIFDPPISSTSTMIWMKVNVRWDALDFAPYNVRKAGGVYVAYTITSNSGPGGYFGIQIHKNGGQFLFSIWDGDRWESKGGKKTAKASTQLVWPMDMELCKRNCQDCGMASLKKTKGEGLTTGTQCKLRVPDMKVGDAFELVLKRTTENRTINTKKYGGMPESHRALKEGDKNVTGGVWVVTARQIKPKRKKTVKVGEILFEGDGSGMKRLGTFDEMLGCNGCNMIYHKDTRYGMKIKYDNGKRRTPKEMQGRTKAGGSKCADYGITGSEKDSSITFEGGPLTEKIFYKDGKLHTIWPAKR